MIQINEIVENVLVTVEDVTDNITIQINETVAPVTIAVSEIGLQGLKGEGVPNGGTTGQVLTKIDNTDYNTEWVTNSGGGGATNLEYTPSPTNGTVTSDTGTDATIPLADGTNAGLLTPAEKTKITNTSGTNTGDNATNTQYSGLAASIALKANDNAVVHLAGDETITGSKIFTGTINATSENDYAISAISTNADGLSAESTNGVGVFGSSVNGMGGVFMTTNNANIAQFQTGFDIKVAIKNDGKITATAGTASTDVVVKSQLDTKQDTLSFTPYNATNPSGYQTAAQVQTIADAKVVQTITDGVTATAPSQDAVFDALALKQDTLQNTVNIKSINGTSILGSGNLTVSATFDDLDYVLSKRFRTLYNY